MKPVARTTRRRGQRGQALTEFLIAALAVIPLFLLVPLIGKYQDISNSTQLAARYAAFETMTRNDTAGTFKPEAQLRDEVARRFFSNIDAPIKTNDVAGNFKAHQNLLWRDPQGEPLVRDLSRDVQVSFGTSNSTTHAGGFKSSTDGTIFVPFSEPLGLRSRGIYQANVKVKIANLPSGLKFFEPFDNINLSMTRSTALLVDPWTARGPADVESRIASAPVVFPAGSLASAGSAANAVIGIVDAPGGISGPKLGKLDFWRDVVPEDRLRSRN